MNPAIRSTGSLKRMLLPAIQYILLHTCSSRMITSLFKARPMKMPKIKREVGALKYMDSYSMNGGYVPSYIDRPKGKGRYVPMKNWEWYAESKESSGGSVRQSGGGIGRLDSANEDGFFFKLNKSRLRKLKELLKERGELKSKENPAEKK